MSWLGILGLGALGAGIAYAVTRPKPSAVPSPGSDGKRVWGGYYDSDQWRQRLKEEQTTSASSSPKRFGPLPETPQISDADSVSLTIDQIDERARAVNAALKDPPIVDSFVRMDPNDAAVYGAVEILRRLPTRGDIRRVSTVAFALVPAYEARLEHAVAKALQLYSPPAYGPPTVSGRRGVYQRGHYRR